MNAAELARGQRTLVQFVILKEGAPVAAGAPCLEYYSSTIILEIMLLCPEPQKTEQDISNSPTLSGVMTLELFLVSS